MNTLFNNKKNPPPIKLFEVSDCVVQDTSKETFSRNVRRATCVYAGLTSGFETVDEAIAAAQKEVAAAKAAAKAAGKDKAKLEAAKEQEAAAQKAEAIAKKDLNLAFTLEPLPDGLDKAFLNGRSAKVVVKGVAIGVLGVIHPEVC